MTAGHEARTHDATEVVNAVRRILRALRVAAGATQAAGISAAQLYVLRQLTDDSALSINELAARTLTDRSSVASVVERLEARGLVDRSKSAQDRRRAEVRITKAGREMLAHAPPPPTELLVGALARLSDMELRNLAHSLTELVHAMNLDHAAAPMMFEE